MLFHVTTIILLDVKLGREESEIIFETFERFLYSWENVKHPSSINTKIDNNSIRSVQEKGFMMLGNIRKALICKYCQFMYTAYCPLPLVGEGF